MDSAVIPVSVLEDLAQNIGLIAILVITYSVIPDKLRMGSKRMLALFIGIVFGFAAILSMFIPLEIALGAILEIKTIIVPVAGFFGGPIAAILVALFAILFHITPPQGIDYPGETAIIIIGAITGTVFYYLRREHTTSWHEMVRLLVLGAVIAVYYTGISWFYVSPEYAKYILEPAITITTALALITGTLALGLLLDLVDRRKRAEHKIREYQEHLETLVDERTRDLEQAVSLQKATIESTADGILVVSREGTVRAYNNRLLKILNLPEDPVIGENFKKLSEYAATQSDDPDAFRRQTIVFRDHPEQESLDKLVFTDGTVFELHTLPQRQDDRIIGQVLNFRDITQRQRDEEALKESEQRLSLALSASRQGTYDLNLETREIFLSDSTYGMIGIETGRIITPAQVVQMVHPDDVALLTDMFRNDAGATVDDRTIEFRFRHASGEWRWFESRGRVVSRDANGRAIRLIGTLADITERKRAEESLMNANKKFALLSSITRHDILNQISALYSYVELAQNKNTDPDTRSYLGKIFRQLEIVQFQVEFTRDYQDLGLHSPAWQDAGAAFREAASHGSGGDRKIVIDVDRLEVYADPMFGKVFSNLIDNSLRHGGQVTELRFSAEPVDAGMLLVYEDNGRGIPDEDKDRIFSKGFGKNTGLGMFLANEILSITGITLRETGVFNKGARFEMLVPKGFYRVTRES
jgi:PAS domain S-box-containing protein